MTTPGDLAMLDRNGTLVRCAPQFILNCDAQRVLNANNWEGPKSLTIWARKLYILDSEAGQIWRYDPSGSSYVSAPREYFAGSARPNLRNVVDFTISQKGTVYVLYDDGIIKYLHRRQRIALCIQRFQRRQRAAHRSYRRLLSQRQSVRAGILPHQPADADDI